MKSSESIQPPSQPMKPAISSGSEALTRSEIDALKQKKKQLSGYYQKKMAERTR